jgi:ABC-2 type transport system ATP-binding protein
MRIDVASLSFRRAGRAVLEAVSFHVSAGEILGVIGPNGAGKSTLLEAAAGLHPAASGEVRVDGRIIVSFHDRAAVMALMPDGAELPEEATVAEVLGARAQSEAARGLGVAPLLSARAGRLSRGETKRVLLAATLAEPKPVLLLDEPFSAFDPRQLRAVLPVVRTRVGEGTAAVVTIHQMSTAEACADRLLMLSEGRVLACGTAAELRARAGVSGSLDDVFVALLDAGDSPYAT